MSRKKQIGRKGVKDIHEPLWQFQCLVTKTMGVVRGKGSFHPMNVLGTKHRRMDWIGFRIQLEIVAKTSATCGSIPPHIEWEVYCRCDSISINPQNLRAAREPATWGWNGNLQGRTGETWTPIFIDRVPSRWAWRFASVSGPRIGESKIGLITT